MRANDVISPYVVADFQAQESPRRLLLASETRGGFTSVRSSQTHGWYDEGTLN